MKCLLKGQVLRSHSAVQPHELRGYAHLIYLQVPADQLRRFR